MSISLIIQLQMPWFGTNQPNGWGSSEHIARLLPKIHAQRLAR
jgi:hypothetical protein